MVGRAESTLELEYTGPHEDSCAAPCSHKVRVQAAAAQGSLGSTFSQYIEPSIIESLGRALSSQWQSCYQWPARRTLPSALAHSGNDPFLDLLDTFAMFASSHARSNQDRNYIPSVLSPRLSKNSQGTITRPTAVSVMP